jgi:hypothetical protein
MTSEKSMPPSSYLGWVVAALAIGWLVIDDQLDRQAAVVAPPAQPVVVNQASEESAHKAVNAVATQSQDAERTESMDAPPSDDTEGLAKHDATHLERWAYRRSQGSALAIGLKLPRFIDGPKEMWDDLVALDKTYEPEVSAAKDKKSSRLMAYALKKQERERVGDIGKVVSASKIDRSGPGETVHIGTPEGVFQVKVLPGEDAELDRLQDELKVLCTANADALMHVLRSHGVLK